MKIRHVSKSLWFCCSPCQCTNKKRNLIWIDTDIKAIFPKKISNTPLPRVAIITSLIQMFYLTRCVPPVVHYCSLHCSNNTITAWGVKDPGPFLFLLIWIVINLIYILESCVSLLIACLVFFGICFAVIVFCGNSY